MLHKVSTHNLYKRPEPLRPIFFQNQLSLHLYSTIIPYKLPELLLPIIVGLNYSMESINAYKLLELLSPIISGISCSMKSANAYNGRCHYYLQIARTTIAYNYSSTMHQALVFYIKAEIIKETLIEKVNLHYIVLAVQISHRHGNKKPLSSTQKNQ